MIALLAVPLVACTCLVVAAGAGSAQAPVPGSDCGGEGTTQTIGGVRLDAEQMGDAQTIVSATADRQLPAFAAVIAIDVAYTESGLRNSAVQADSDSEGLFQQRVSIYTAAVAANPVAATNAFMDRLLGVTDWQTNTVGSDAQTIQVSAHPERYPANVVLAQAIVSRLWAAAAAAVNPGSADICPGAGGAMAGGDSAGPIVGPTGSVIAGITTIPPALTISGTVRGTIAVRFALKQLGKPYVWGAAGPAAFDCSGLTMAAWAAAGIALPHLAAAQAGRGVAEATDLLSAVGGDLVMIPGSDGTASNPGHVGMVAGYVDEPDGRHLYIIQAPETGVPVELTQATEWAGKIVDVRHVA